MVKCIRLRFSNYKSTYPNILVTYVDCVGILPNQHLLISIFIVGRRANGNIFQNLHFSMSLCLFQFEMVLSSIAD